MSNIVKVSYVIAGNDGYRCQKCGVPIPRGERHIAVLGSAMKGDPIYTLRYHWDCTEHRPVMRPRQSPNDDGGTRLGGSRSEAEQPTKDGGE